MLHKAIYSPRKVLTTKKYSPRKVYVVTMKRLLYNELLKWKESRGRKPLVLEGARQVGKTWLLKEFGRNEYDKVAYINCDNNPSIKDIFYNFDIDRIVRVLSAISNVHITPSNTLIILDEVQEAPLALTSLKYFEENGADYHIAVAGSLLGIRIHSGTGFPVGKTDFLKLYPLSFREFIMALGKNQLLELMDAYGFEELNAMSEELTELLRQYYFVGGMPAVVNKYIETYDLQAVRRLQKGILADYERDFSKHAPKNEIAKIHLVWSSIGSQLAKENKKFIYGAIRKGARAKDFENAIIWLINAGLVYKIPRVKLLEMPLKFYEDLDAFKLFMLDVGLLGAAVNAEAKDILLGTNAFTSYKGSFTEEFIAEEFVAAIGEKLYYYTNDNSTLEIDFVAEFDRVYPIEVKAETNLKAKSLSTVLNKNEAMTGLRFSMANYKEQERIVNIPLPLASSYFKCLKDKTDKELKELSEKLWR